MATPITIGGVDYRPVRGQGGKLGGGVEVCRLRSPGGELVWATRSGGGPWSLVGVNDATIGKPRLERGRAPSRRFGR